MKYFVSVDKDGYVLNIQHTNSPLDYLELDLDQYDLSGLRKFAHKIGKDKLVFDEDRYQDLLNKQTQKDNEKEIEELQQKLNESDYLVARTFEQVMELTNPITFVADVLKILAQFKAKYKEVIKNRQAWRTRIEELRNK